MKNAVPTDPVKMSLLALPESTPAALYGLYEVLSSVGVSWAEVTGDGEPAPLMEVKIVSEDGRDFTSAIGTPIAPHAALHEVNRTDIVIVADLALLPERARRESHTCHKGVIPARGGAQAVTGVTILSFRPPTTIFSITSAAGVIWRLRRVRMPTGRGMRGRVSGIATRPSMRTARR